MKKSREQIMWRALGILANRPAHELVARPLDTLSDLRHRGFATIARRYTEGCSHCQEVVITEAGREALRKGIP